MRCLSLVLAIVVPLCLGPLTMIKFVQHNEVVTAVDAALLALDAPEADRINTRRVIDSLPAYTTWLMPLPGARSDVDAHTDSPHAIGAHSDVDAHTQSSTCAGGH